MTLVLKPREFLSEHIDYINQYREAIKIISENNPGLIMGLKDVDSHYLISNPAYSNAVGIKSPEAMVGLSDNDLPYISDSPFAEQYKSEDKHIIKNPHATYSYVKVHQYADGFKARIIHKSAMYHAKSDTILGVVFSGYEVDFSSLFTLIPNYENLMEKASIMQLMPNTERLVINGTSLTAYEYEVCYLLSNGWGCEEVADFMNHRNPNQPKRSGDTIVKAKDRICLKFRIPNQLYYFRQELRKLHIHNKPPLVIIQAFTGCSHIGVRQG